MEELERQRVKILAALSAIDADVFGLIEMENTTGVEPLADLVAGLNQAAGAAVYDYVDTGTIGTDAIRVGIIYKPATVTPVGAPAILDSSVDPRFVDNLNRPVLAQTFADGSGACSPSRSTTSSRRARPATPWAIPTPATGRATAT